METSRFLWLFAALSLVACGGGSGADADAGTDQLAPPSPGSMCSSDDDCPAGSVCVFVQHGEFFDNFCGPGDAGASVVDMGVVPVDASAPPPDLAVVGTPVQAIKVSSGGSSTCVVSGAGAVRCWGSNDQGQLGDGTTTPHYVAQDVAALGAAAQAVAVGTNHACALLSTGAVKCWGGNDFGQVGDGTTTRRLAPAEALPAGSGAVAIYAGYLMSCALLSSGTLKCWGNNGDGQLGDGTAMERHVPTDAVAVGGGVTSLGIGGNAACASFRSGAVRCWGYNSFGGLGDGTKNSTRTPVDVALPSAAAEVSAGLGYIGCARLSSGAVRCWGANHAGEVGDGTTMERLSPVDATALGGAATTAIVAGSCALLTTGEVRCWGVGGVSGLVPLGAAATSITLGACGCAVLADNAVKCWGPGACGDGNATSSGAPVTVLGVP